MFQRAVIRAWLRIRRVVDDVQEEDRGDVPGWVLITLMSVGLVVLLWAIAGPALQSMLEGAIDRVGGIR